MADNVQETGEVQAGDNAESQKGEEATTVKAEEAKPEEKQQGAAQETEPKEIEATEAAPKEGEAKEGEAKEGEAKEGEAKEGEAKEGEVKEGEAKEGEAKEGEAKEGEAKEGEAKEGEAKEGEAKEGEAKEGEAKEGEAKEVEAKEGEQKEGDRKPSQMGPSVAELTNLEANAENDDVKSEIEDSKADVHEGSEAFLLQYEEEEEEVVEEEVVEEIPFDREIWYTIYLKAMVDYSFTKRLNTWFHKKMSEYFRKRKMEHVMVECDHYDEAYAKYAKKLRMFYQLIEMNRQQRAEITEELRKMRQIRDKQISDANEAFKSMLSRETEIGTGLISTKTGKEIPEKVLEKMIIIQRDKALELQDLRLIHIKIGNGVQDKAAALRSMDRIGDNYTLMEFEQLKMENEGHADKIEERDEELARLRKKCNEAIQCLAHVREKCSAVEIQVKELHETVVAEDKLRLKAREEVNKLKQERDYYRTETQQMKAGSGLLTKDKLLVDMELSFGKCDDLEEELRAAKKKLEYRKAIINAIKKNYEKESRKPKYRTSRMKSLDMIQKEKRISPRKSELKCHTLLLELKAIQSVNSLAK